MNTAILYLPYLPNIIWLQNFLQHDSILIEQHENFVKSSNRNRSEIAGANGKQLLTIPIVGGRDHHQSYQLVRIASVTNWQKIHWQSIVSAYGSAPYFEFYAHAFQPFYEQKCELLFDFNLRLLGIVLSVLKIQKPYTGTTAYKKLHTDVQDFRAIKNDLPTISTPRYYQVFEDRNGYFSNLSALDLIFNLGPQAKDYLQGLK